MRGNGRLLWALIIVLFCVSAAGIYAWLSRSAPSSTPVAAQQEAAQAVRRDEPLPVTLYYPAGGMLAGEPAAIRRQPDLQAQADEALRALFADQRTQLAGVYKDVKLRAFFLDASGTAYVDLSPGQQNGVYASTAEELLSLYGIVDTLAQNFEEIKQVRFLVDGREAQTLAGHIDLSRKFEKRMDLVK